MLCGRYGTHTSNIYRHCRACDVSWEDLDNPDVIFEKVNAADMAAICWSDQQTLREWSQHQVDNVFNEIEFGDPERGIFGATPIENVSSVLLTEWTWSPEYHCVSGDTIVGPIFVIIIKEDFSKIRVAREYDEWASHFT